MKRLKRVYILLGVLALVCAGIFCVNRIEEEQERIKNSEEIILALEASEIQNLSWEYEESSFSFHRDEEGIWKYDEDEAFPVNDEKIAELLSIFASFGVSFVIEEVEDYSQYGLDEPVATIQLDTKEQSYTLELGAFSKLDSQRYVSIGDGNAYLVTTDPLETYDLEIKDLIMHDEYHSFSSADRVVLEGVENYTIEYKEDETASYCLDDVYYVGDLPLDTSKVKSFLRGISNLSLTDYVSYNVSEEELETYHLASPDLKLTIDHSVINEDETKTSYTLDLNIGIVEDEDAEDTSEGQTENQKDADGEAAEPEVTLYARVGESKMVYRLSPTDEEKILAAGIDDLRHVGAFTADFEEVTELQISLEGNLYTMRKVVNEEEEPLWYYGEKEIDIADIQTELEGLKAESFTEEAATGQEEIGLMIYLDNAHATEQEIILYRYDGSNCLAVVNGEPHSLISRSAVVQMIEAVHAIVLEN